MVLDLKEGENGEAEVETLVSVRFMKMVYCSCVHKVLQAYLLNDSGVYPIYLTEFVQSLFSDGHQ